MATIIKNTTLLKLIILNLFSFSLFAQKLTDENLVKDNSYYFEIVNNEAIGSGFNILRNQIENSQFIILGEEHYSAKVSEFTNAIVSTLAKNDFKYFACEIGPNSAEKITELIKKNNSFSKYMTKIELDS